MYLMFTIALQHAVEVCNNNNIIIIITIINSIYIALSIEYVKTAGVPKHTPPGSGPAGES